MFEGFLEQQQKSSEIVWIFREDMVRFRRSFGVRTPVPESNKYFAESLFELARARNNGIELSVFFFDSRRAFSYIYVPTDTEDAKDRMMFQQLKLTIRENPVGVHRFVRLPTILWWFAQKNYSLRCPTFIDRDIPAQSGLGVT